MPSIILSQSRKIPLLMQLSVAFALGITLLFAVGFVQTDIVHNAAHDTRHSLAFPCH